MSAFKYEYIVIGRWRNRDKVNEVVRALRDAGKSVYCFTDNGYEGDGIKVEVQEQADPEIMMGQMESINDWQTNPTFRKIFETDLQGLRDAEKLVMVFPAGFAAHMEFGVAYGLGKPCFAVGTPEKPETLYLMFDKIFPNAAALTKDQMT